MGRDRTKPRVNLPIVPELYDLELDPAESYECSAANPLVASQLRVRVEQMLRLFPSTVEQCWRDKMSRRVEYTPSGALPVGTAAVAVSFGKPAFTVLYEDLSFRS